MRVIDSGVVVELVAGGLDPERLGAYDATYVALAEMTDATALLTTDARLAGSSGPECHIEVLSW